MVTKSRLHKHFTDSELPEELGGTLAYNHEQWLRNRMVCAYNLFHNILHRLTQFINHPYKK